ncbi:MAG: fatty acid desaturase [Pseudomonadota bacterium]
MSDHKAFLSALPEETRRALTERSDGHGLARLALHLGLIAAIGVWIAAEGPFWAALLPLQGVLIVFLFTLQHECTHKTPFRSEWVNEAVGRLSGLMILQPFEWFRYYHLAHHRHTGDPGRDPELAGGPRRGWAAFWIGLSGWGYWRHNIGVLIANAAGRPGPHAPARAAGRIAWEARLMLALYLLAALSFVWTDALLWAWLAPMAIGMPALRLYLLAEHGRCPMVADMFANTRTTFTNAVVRFVAWNMPYHTEHHVFPAVPFHRLPDLARLMSGKRENEAQGFRRFAARYVAGIGREREGER